MLLLEGSGTLDRIAARAPEVKSAMSVHGTKDVGERIVFEETVNLTRLFETFGEDTRVALEDGALGSYNTSGQNVLRSLGGTASFEIRDPTVLGKLASRANMLSGDVSQTTFNEIRETIRQGFWVDRKGIDEVARRLDNKFSILSRSRATTIARTETLIAVEQATQDSFQRNGIERRQWIAAIASPTPPRPSHLRAHGQIVLLTESFVLNSEKGTAYLKHPGDPSAPPGEIIRCRCDQLALMPERFEVEDVWTGQAAA